MEIKRSATENLLIFAERLEISVVTIKRVPKEFRENKTNLCCLIEIIISHMVKIEETIEPEWEKPKEGFCEESSDDTEVDTVKLGISSSINNLKDAHKILTELLVMLGIPTCCQC